ncbi:MAG: HutP [Candidatus Riflebacteria bacterium]|nr:HutP [Candidatus Riflebacteria bacterium]
MEHPPFEKLLLQDGVVSLSKAATLCSMVDNEYDDLLVEYLKKYDIRAVITRAGGVGDNLKNKILRNAFGAAENSGLVTVNMNNRYAIITLVKDILSSFEDSITSVSGGGFKIGLAVRDRDIAMAIFGNTGLAGLDIDQEISASRILHSSLRD